MTPELADSFKAYMKTKRKASDKTASKYLVAMKEVVAFTSAPAVGSKAERLAFVEEWRVFVEDVLGPLKAWDYFEAFVKG